MDEYKCITYVNSCTFAPVALIWYENNFKFHSLLNWSHCLYRYWYNTLITLILEGASLSLSLSVSLSLCMFYLSCCCSLHVNLTSFNSDVWYRNINTEGCDSSCTYSNMRPTVTFLRQAAGLKRTAASFLLKRQTVRPSNQRQALSIAGDSLFP